MAFLASMSFVVDWRLETVRKPDHKTRSLTLSPNVNLFFGFLILKKKNYCVLPVCIFWHQEHVWTPGTPEEGIRFPLTIAGNWCEPHVGAWNQTRVLGRSSVLSAEPDVQDQTLLGYLKLWSYLQPSFLQLKPIFP